ncbi:hypothetical protein RHMOL_Rhmol05G0143200 [Rhododendron molle]|nr:hypothetical protein RHMOL_Rhmol05G0143200 [Rhododendron molle]
MPSKRAKQVSWFKKLFCQGVAIIKCQRKEKVARRGKMREQKRQKKDLAWQTSLLEQKYGVKYVLEPLEEAEVNDGFAGYANEKLAD